MAHAIRVSSIKAVALAFSRIVDGCSGKTGRCQSEGRCTWEDWRKTTWRRLYLDIFAPRLPHLLDDATLVTSALFALDNSNVTAQPRGTAIPGRMADRMYLRARWFGRDGYGMTFSVVWQLRRALYQ